METTTIKMDTCRALALLQHEGESFFFTGSDFYKGATESEAIEAWEQSENYETTTFDEFCASTYEIVEDYDNDGDYLVLTDSEADEKWGEYIDSYIEECVLSEIPERYRFYFDTEGFKKDCEIDGRGHSLACDGAENEVNIDLTDTGALDSDIEETNFFIYRIN